MIESLKNIFCIPDLRNRVLFTLGMLAIYRLGNHVPIPGVDVRALTEFLDQNRATLCGLVYMSPPSKVTVFALGIVPYISASIILSLLTVVWPYLERLSKEGELGRRKITQYTRYGTVLLSVILPSEPPTCRFSDRSKHMKQSGAMPMSNAFRQMRALFNRLPRRELFYAPVEELQPFLNRIVQITGDDEIAIHHRIGAGYVALYLAFSKQRYSYELEENLRRTLSQRFGPITYAMSQDTESAQVVFFYFDLHRMDRRLDEDEILKITERLLTTWPEAVSRRLTEAFGEKQGRRLLQRWVTHETRSGLYREATPPHEVPFDVEHLDALEGRLEVAVVPRSPEHTTLKVYALKPLGFIEILTTLGNLGLKVTGELHIPIKLPDGQTAHLYRYEIVDDAKGIQALIEGCDRVTDAVRALDEERASDGSLNVLVLRAELNWRQVEVLRTYRNHLQQIRPHYNVETVNGVLLRNADVARALFHVFEARFDPQIDGRRSKVTERAEAELQTALDAVRSLVEDEVLRALGSLISATVRTNFYQIPERPVVSIKVDSHKVEGMPSPKPMYEIYVHSRRLEGIHLRGGRIARGGIRWSDRHDDFRTEVLDLMKTQMVKNSIIVPVGSKGGFVLKGSLPPRPRRLPR